MVILMKFSANQVLLAFRVMVNGQWEFIAEAHSCYNLILISKFLPNPWFIVGPEPGCELTITPLNKHFVMVHLHSRPKRNSV